MSGTAFFLYFCILVLIIVIIGIITYVCIEYNKPPNLQGVQNQGTQNPGLQPVQINGPTPPPQQQALYVPPPIIIQDDLEQGQGQVQEQVQEQFVEVTNEEIYIDTSLGTDVREFLSTPLEWVKIGNYVGQPIVKAIFEKYLGRSILYNYTPSFLGGLEYDCYDPIGKVAIEYQGIQHYQYTPYYHKNGEIDLEKQKKRDIAKQRLAEENGDVLILVPCYVDAYKWSNMDDEYKPINMKKEEFWKYREIALIKYLLPLLDQIYTIV